MAVLLNMVKGNNYYIIPPGKLYSAHTEILKYLHECLPSLNEVTEVEKCDVILVFCPIVSRAGTDIDAALNQLNNCSEFKQAVFIVLHHTFDGEKILPDSSRFITRRNTFTVNCLFNEDVRLLEFSMNKKELDKIILHLKPQIQVKKARVSKQSFKASIKVLVCIAITALITAYCYRALK